GVADEADRSALDPSSGVDAGRALVGVLGEHLTLVVRDHAVALVERYALQRRTEVSDGAVHLADGDLAHLAGADESAGSVSLGALVDDRRNLAFGVRLDLDRLRPEVQVQPAGRLASSVIDGGTLTPRLQNPVDDLDLLVAGHCR